MLIGTAYCAAYFPATPTPFPICRRRLFVKRNLKSPQLRIKNSKLRISMPFPTATTPPPATNPGRGSDRELQNHTLRNPSNCQTSARFSMAQVGQGSCRASSNMVGQGSGRAQTFSQAAALYFECCTEGFRTSRETLTITNSPTRRRRFQAWGFSVEKIRARREPRPTEMASCTVFFPATAAPFSISQRRLFAKRDLKSPAIKN